MGKLGFSNRDSNDLLYIVLFYECFFKKLVWFVFLNYEENEFVWDENNVRC